MTHEENSSSVGKSRELPTVEIAVPCYGPQPSSWWQRFTMNLLAENKTSVRIKAIGVSMSMLPDDNKNKLSEFVVENQLKETAHRKHQTDINRNILARWFTHPEDHPNRIEEGPADYIVFIDADTKPPKGFIRRLIDLKREFVSGLYFLPQPPYNPVAYYRRPGGLYEAFYNYQLGTLVQVDSVGLGCAVIHRSVFERIQKNFTVYMSKITGALFPIYNEDIVNTNKYSGKKKHPWIANGTLSIPVEPVDWTEETSPWPYFALEYARTEDHFFCELAERVGIKPYLDTNIVCDHMKVKDINEEQYQMHKAQYSDMLKRKVRKHGN